MYTHLLIYLLVPIFFIRYQFGYVHCDPHPHNLLVRPHPRNPHHAQIVLLDHGLYRTLTDDFRHNYTRLWHSIVMSNEEGIKRYAHALNAGMYTWLLKFYIIYMYLYIFIFKMSELCVY